MFRYKMHPCTDEKAICQIKVGGNSMQAGAVVANQNKLPFREEDNSFDHLWDNLEMFNR